MAEIWQKPTSYEETLSSLWTKWPIFRALFVCETRTAKTNMSLQKTVKGMEKRVLLDKRKFNNRTNSNLYHYQ
jgi:hypothetical protein